MRCHTAAILLLAASSAVAAPISGRRPIIGGTPTLVGEYPNVVAIEVNGGLCTGTLIDPEWVLTAAHCVTPHVVGLTLQVEVTAAIQIRLGTIDAFTPSGVTVSASASIPDPLFDIHNVGAHDAGLIKLAQPVTWISPAALNFVAGNAPVGISVTMVGFGQSAIGGGSVGVEYSVTQVSSQCGANGNDASLLCFDQTDGAGQCDGDSGGPSLEWIDGVPTVVAMTSFGDPSCSKFIADTRIDAVKDFILDNVPSLGCTSDATCPSTMECFERQCIMTPFSTSGIGSTCAEDDDCDSKECASGDGGPMCTMPCTVGMSASCPSGFACVDGGETGKCWPSGDVPVTPGGCQTSPDGAPASALAILLALSRRRRRLGGDPPRSRVVRRRRKLPRSVRRRRRSIVGCGRTLTPMSRLAAVMLFVLGGSAIAGPVEDPIIGGTPATAGEFPNVVAIEIGGALCTGTLVAPQWVLTAGHCVTASEVGVSTQAQVTAAVQVHFNTVNAFQMPGMVVGASDSIPDPMYANNGGTTHDAGLIKLATPVTTIVPATLNFVAASAPVGIGVTMVGFGATAVGQGGSVGIEYVVMQTSVSCSIAGGSDADLLCYNQSIGKGKCNGDSGGPSYATIGGNQVEVGITSFGDQNCAQFGADTRVDAEKAFILQHIPELECSSDSDCPAMKECFDKHCIVMPFTATGLGSACTSNTGCDSMTCAMGNAGSLCTMTCTIGMPDTCPAAFDCIMAGAGGACWPTADDGSSGGGCCEAGGNGAPTMCLGIAIVGLAARRRRRRRR